MNTTETPDPQAWFTSSASNQGSCVETARVSGGMLVRDSKVVGSARIAFGAAAWETFLQCQCPDDGTGRR
ncbi:DUF397 domain-containing protein [Streptodolium elevatio]